MAVRFVPAGSLGFVICGTKWFLRPSFWNAHWHLRRSWKSVPLRICHDQASTSKEGRDRIAAVVGLVWTRCGRSGKRRDPYCRRSLPKIAREQAQIGKYVSDRHRPANTLIAAAAYREAKANRCVSKPQPLPEPLPLEFWLARCRLGPQAGVCLWSVMKQKADDLTQRFLLRCAVLLIRPDRYVRGLRKWSGICLDECARYAATEPSRNCIAERGDGKGTRHAGTFV